jgi:hypothetical protein
MKIGEYNAARTAEGLDPKYRAAVITVHGMNTTGRWQKDLATFLQDRLIRHKAVDYGFVLLGVLLPWTPAKVHERLNHAYEDQRRFFERPHVIAHSFGSRCLGKWLQRFPSNSISRVILCGSLIPRRFDWGQLAANGQVDRVMNERAGKDLWVKLAPLAIWGSGCSGVLGFKDCGNIVDENFYPHSKHSDLFMPAHWEKVWLPFLTGP